MFPRLCVTSRSLFPFARYFFYYAIESGTPMQYGRGSVVTSRENDRPFDRGNNYKDYMSVLQPVPAEVSP